MKIRKYLSIVSVALVALLSSCGPDEPVYTLPTFAITDTEGAALTTLDLSAEAATKTIKIAANRAWTIEFTADWLAVNPTSCENANNADKVTEVVIDVTANTGAMRTAPLTISYGEKNITFNVVQQSGVQRDYTTLKDLRALYTTADVTIPENTWIKGTVISNTRFIENDNGSLNNFGSAKNLVIQDATAGMLVYAAAAPDFAPGDIVEIDATGTTLTQYGAAAELTNVALDKITKIGSETLTAKNITVTELLSGNYEWQYIAVPAVQVVSADLEKNFAVASAFNEITFENAAGETFVVYSGKYATPLQSVKVPQGSGVLKGIAGRYNDKIQIMLTYLTDFEGMTGERFAPEVSTSTISQITAAGNYEVANATVVAAHSKGVLVKDATGYILVYLNAAPTVAVGDVVTVKGAVSVRNDLFQFGEGTTLSKTSTATVSHPTVEVMTAAKIDEYITTPAYKYVEMSGSLAVSVSGTSTYYNVTVDGTAVKGSIAYPAESLGVAALNDKTVKVTGYAVGYSGSSSKYFNVMALSVVEDTNAPTLTVNPASLSWAADAVDAKTVTVAAATAGAASTEWTAALDSETNFTIAVDKTAGTVTVTPKAANASDNDFTATLTIAFEAINKTVKLTQAKIAAATGSTVYLTSAEISKALVDFGQTVSDYKDFTITSASGNWSANASAKNDLTYLQLRAKSGSHVLSPVFAKNIVSIKININASTTAGRQVYIMPADFVAPTGSYTATDFATSLAVSDKTADKVAQSFTLTPSSSAKQFNMCVLGGATYIDSIEINLAE